MAALALTGGCLAGDPTGPGARRTPIDQILAAGSGPNPRARSVDVVEVHPEHVLVGTSQIRRSVASTSDSSQRSLGVYQWAPQEARSAGGGRGLVYRVAAGTRNRIFKVREQPPLSDRADWIGQVVTDAARRDPGQSSSAPRPGSGLPDLPFQSSCPGPGEGGS